MMPESDDETSVMSTLRSRSGIFACNDAVVISRQIQVLGSDTCGNDVLTWLNDVPHEASGADETLPTFRSTMTFQIAWATIIGSGKVWDHDWTVKVDPGVVFFPDRLRPLAIGGTGSTAYFTSCNDNSTGRDLLMVSLEIVSKQAIGAYKDFADSRCGGIDWSSSPSDLGADAYMQECMARCGVDSIDSVALVSSDRCFPNAHCSNSSVVAFSAGTSGRGRRKCSDDALR
jgi:hypothetical protein